MSVGVGDEEENGDDLGGDTGRDLVGSGISAGKSS